MFPKRLKKGDCIGIISPSWGAAGLFPHRTKNGIAQLERLGYKVKVGKHSLNSIGYLSDTAENRVADLHQMFADKEVNAIVTAIGGEHSCQMLPLINFDLIKKNPKIFIGYSDITVLNIAIWKKTGLTTFNGPTLLNDFAEYPNILDYTLLYFKKVTQNHQKITTVVPSEYWTEEFLDWEFKKDLERPRKINKNNDKWIWLRKGDIEGILMGGCIESMQHLRGTKYFPNWDKMILFFEISSDKPLPETIDGILMDYENMGVLKKLRGIVVGRPSKYTEKEKEELYSILLERTVKFNLPLIVNLDFGHTSPQCMLPIGSKISIKSNTQTLKIYPCVI